MSKPETLLLAIFVFFCAWVTPSPAIVNSMTRVGLTHAIVAHGDLTIDEIAPLEIDKAKVGDHFYCDKAPGVSLLCVPPVALANVAMDLAGMDDGLVAYDGQRAKATPRYVISALACLGGALIPISALALLLFYRSLRRAGVEEMVGRGASLLFALGTPFLFWSSVVFGHATAAALLFIGFAQRWGFSDEGRDRPGLILAGLSLGAATAVEFLAAVPAAVIALFLLHARMRGSFDLERVRDAIWLAAGGAAPVAAVLLYNWLAFGSPFHLGYSSVQGFEGMKTGFFGISMPRPGPLKEITVGMTRGILWLSPALACAGIACLLGLRSPSSRPACVVAIVIAAYYLLANAGYHYWDGGWSTGPRHVTPMLPFLVFGLGLTYSALPRRLRIASVITGIISMVLVTVAALINVRIPNDGGAIWSDHIVPDFLAGRSQMLLAEQQVPPLILFSLPLLALAVVSALLVGPGIASGLTRRR